MKVQKCLRMAINMVIHSKLRSYLTILGIVIGVASVITIVSVGDGLEKSITDQLSTLGGDTITITPGYSKAGGSRGPPNPSQTSGDSLSDDLTRNDVQVLKGISDIDYIDTRISGSVDVYYMGDEASLSVTGVDQKVWADVTTNEVGEGRLLSSSDQNVIVIGYDLAHDYFDNDLGINKVLTIEDKAFRVVGVLEDGAGLGTGSKSIYMPIDSAYDVLDDKEDGVYDSINLKAKEDADIDLLVAKIEKKLDILRHVNDEDDKDYTVTSMKQIQDQVGEITGTLTLFLGAIAVISLVVGAVGIANTMFTSVLEKTKEIGILKAIGARNGDILLIFIFNAGVIELVGGILGVIFGIGASNLLSVFLVTPNGEEMSTVIDPIIVVGSLFISILVGMISGIVPAYQGSRFKPVDALRTN